MSRFLTRARCPISRQNRVTARVDGTFRQHKNPGGCGFTGIEQNAEPISGLYVGWLDCLKASSRVANLPEEFRSSGKRHCFELSAILSDHEGLREEVNRLNLAAQRNLVAGARMPHLGRRDPMDPHQGKQGRDEIYSQADHVHSPI